MKKKKKKDLMVYFKAGIYSITYLSTGQVYWGQTANFLDRVARYAKFFCVMKIDQSQVNTKLVELWKESKGKQKFFMVNTDITDKDIRIDLENYKIKETFSKLLVNF